MSERPPKPRARDAFWVQCFTAALGGSAAAAAREDADVQRLVREAMEIADEAVALVRASADHAISGHDDNGARPIPDRSRHSPQHVGAVKVHKA